MTLLISKAKGIAAEQLMESDALYFELGAVVQHLEGCDLVYMPGLTAMPAGCVVQRINKALAEKHPRVWVRSIERAVQATAARQVRFYLHQPAPRLEAALQAGGYSAREERALVVTASHLLTKAPSAMAGHVQLRPVVSDADWQEKQRIHAASRLSPDGYANPAAAWTELLRRKSRTGLKVSYLIERCGQACGTVGAIEMPHLLRVKNLLIQPQSRCQGVASAALRKLANLAARRGKATLGVFVIQGSSGAPLYQKLGFEIESRQVEWTKPLGKE